ncbi:tyrosine-type recombinase/integrase, partial [Acidiphilium sp. AL]|nr:tyrosine-type recombinase/integrase [Acidiphilium sp. AL]
DPCHAPAPSAPRVRGPQVNICSMSSAFPLLHPTQELEPPGFPARFTIRFLALTAVRPGELRGARWDEFEGLHEAAPVWLIPAERMKMKRPHAVPLARQAVEVIEAVRSLTGRLPFVFPNGRSGHKPMSENAMGYLLNRAGYHHRHVPHGWRAAFK